MNKLAVDGQLEFDEDKEWSGEVWSMSSCTMDKNIGYDMLWQRELQRFRVSGDQSWETINLNDD